MTTERQYITVAVFLLLGGFVLAKSGDSLAWLAFGMAVVLYEIVDSEEGVLAFFLYGPVSDHQR